MIAAANTQSWLRPADDGQPKGSSERPCPIHLDTIRRDSCTSESQAVREMARRDCELSTEERQKLDLHVRMDRELSSGETEPIVSDPEICM